MEKSTKKEFVKKLTDKIKEAGLSCEVVQEAEEEFINVKIEGLSIKMHIKINEIYSSYKNGIYTIDKILEIITTHVSKKKQYQEEINEALKNIENWDYVKENLSIMIIDANNGILKDKIYKKVEDIAIVPQVRAFKKGDKEQSVWLFEDSLEIYGVTKEEYIEEAIKNSAKIHPCKMEKSSQFLMTPDFATIRFEYALSTAALFYKGKLEELHEICGDFLVMITPKEALVAKYSKYTMENLKKFIERAENLLTNSLYLYDGEFKKIN